MEKLPFSPLLYGGKTLVQPAYANDIGRALMLMVYVCKNNRVYEFLIDHTIISFFNIVIRTGKNLRARRFN